MNVLAQVYVITVVRDERDFHSFIRSMRTSDITDNMLHDCNMNLFLCAFVCANGCSCVCVFAYVLLSLLVCGLTQQLATIRTKARHTSVGTQMHARTHTHTH